MLFRSALLLHEVHEVALAIYVEDVLAVNHVIFVSITINKEARNIVLVAKFHCAHKRNRLIVSAI